MWRTCAWTTETKCTIGSCLWWFQKGWMCHCWTILDSVDIKNFPNENYLMSDGEQLLFRVLICRVFQEFFDQDMFKFLSKVCPKQIHLHQSLAMNDKTSLFPMPMHIQDEKKLADMVDILCEIEETLNGVWQKSGARNDGSGNFIPDDFSCHFSGYQLTRVRARWYKPRWYKPDNFGRVVNAQLHHFSDASVKGYSHENSHVTMLIVKHFHECTHHQDKGMTLNEVRSNGLWVVRSLSVVANIISFWVKCQKLRGAVQEQRMSDLPEDRLEPTPPSTYCAVDYFGPFIIKDGMKELKRYGVLFTCMASRAVHIELPTPSRLTPSFMPWEGLFVVEAPSASSEATRGQTSWELVQNSPKP